MPRIGFVINGKYYKQEPDLSSMQSLQNSTWKEADHDKQRFDHAADIVQPFKHGKPNQEFIDLYPEASKDYGFTWTDTPASIYPLW